jgi:hypothetical protein
VGEDLLCDRERTFSGPRIAPAVASTEKTARSPYPEKLQHLAADGVGACNDKVKN